MPAAPPGSPVPARAPESPAGRRPGSQLPRSPSENSSPVYSARPRQLMLKSTASLSLGSMVKAPDRGSAEPDPPPLSTRPLEMLFHRPFPSSRQTFTSRLTASPVARNSIRAIPGPPVREIAARPPPARSEHRVDSDLSSRSGLAPVQPQERSGIWPMPEAWPFFSYYPSVLSLTSPGPVKNIYHTRRAGSHFPAPTPGAIGRNPL